MRNKDRRAFLKSIGIGTIGLFAGNKLIARDLSFIGISEDSFLSFKTLPITLAPIEPLDYGPYHYRAILNSDYVMVGVNIEINKDLVSPLHNLTVYADTLTIKGSIKLNGKRIYVHTRKIVASDDAEIDVTGVPGEEYTRAAPSGSGTGADGTDGAKGKQGDKGGDIKIFAEQITGKLKLTADGGQGGRGQNGGDGQVGRGATPGDDAPTNQNFAGKFSGTCHNDGTDGGVPGLGGEGGDGGNAGVISVATFQATLPDSIKFSLEGGKENSGGKKGNGGSGGPSAPSGEDTQCKDVCPVGRECRIVCNHVGRHNCNNGGRNPDNFLAFRLPKEGKKGKKGESGTPTTRTINASELGSLASITQLFMLLHYAEVEYLNNRIENALSSLLWIEQLTRDNPGSATPPAGSIGSYSTFTIGPTKPEWTSLHDRSLLLIKQLQLGFDFYGLPRNYVPLLTLNTYNQLFNELVPIAKDIQTSYINYQQAKKDNNVFLKSVEEALDKAQEALKKLRDEKKIIDDLISDTDKEVTSLTTALEKQKVIVEVAEADFNNAKEEARGGLTLLDWINIAGSVVALSQGAYPAAANIFKVLNNATMPNNLSEVGGFVKNIQLVSGDISSIKGAYEQFRSKLSDITSNEVKLAVTTENYEKVLDQYLYLPAAVQYKEALRSFVETARTRNQKILDLSGLITNSNKLENEIKQREQEILRIKSNLALNQKPELAECTAFMERLWAETKNKLIYFLYQENRAYEYWLLSTHDFSLDDRNIESIEKTHGDIISARARALEARQNPFVPFETVVSFSDKDTLQQIHNTGRVVLNINEYTKGFIEHPLANVVIREVTVRTTGATTKDSVITLQLQHSGRSRFITTKNEIKEFTHQPRPITISYWIDVANCESQPGANVTKRCTPTTNNLIGTANGEKDAFAYLSPFTSWILNLPEASNDELRRDGITDIQISFKGFGLSQPIPDRLKRKRS